MRKKILVISVDTHQLQTGGTRLTREGSSALKEVAEVIEKEWKKDFNRLSRRNYFLGNLEICKWMIQHRPYVFYSDSRMFAISWCAVIVAKMLNIHFITTLQESHHLIGGKSWQGIGGSIRLFLLKGICRRADILIANSSVTKRLAIEEYGVREEKIKIVCPGFEPEHVVGKQEIGKNEQETTKLHILCVSRYTWRKGVDILLKALQKLDSPDYKATIVGDRLYDAEGEKYWQSLISLAKEANVELRGKVSKSELNELYRWADIVVVPSRYEAFGIVVLEALWRGIVVLVSDALPEEIRSINDAVFSFKNENVEDMVCRIKGKMNFLFKRRLEKKMPLLDSVKWNWQRFRNEFAQAASEVFQK